MHLLPEILNIMTFLSLKGAFYLQISVIMRANSTQKSYYSTKLQKYFLLLQFEFQNTIQIRFITFKTKYQDLYVKANQR